MTQPRGKINKLPNQPFRIAGLIVFLIAALVLWLVYLQYSGHFVDKTKLTMLSDRAGLVMDPGSKVTYNGVQIGRVAQIDEIQRDGKPAAKFTLDVYPKYLHLIPANVDAKIVATTVFGEKYVSMTAPKNPLPQRITPKNVIDARSVTTEINTLFRDHHLDRREAGPGQDQPDAERCGAGAERVGRQVRAVADQRQRHTR